MRDIRPGEIRDGCSNLAKPSQHLNKTLAKVLLTTRPEMDLAGQVLTQSSKNLRNCA
jgi:hypothetical protein